MTTVDDYLRLRGIDRVDLLKTDVEGGDALVLRGAEDALRSGKVAAVIFEYSHMWTTVVDVSQHSLEKTVAFFDQLGFDVFLIWGNDEEFPDLIRLTGGGAEGGGEGGWRSGCFNPLFEYWWWTDVLAISRSHLKEWSPKAA